MLKIAVLDDQELYLNSMMLGSKAPHSTLKSSYIL